MHDSITPCALGHDKAAKILQEELNRKETLAMVACQRFKPTAACTFASDWKWLQFHPFISNQYLVLTLTYVSCDREERSSTNRTFESCTTTSLWNGEDIFYVSDRPESMDWRFSTKTSATWMTSLIKANDFLHEMMSAWCWTQFLASRAAIDIMPIYGVQNHPAFQL